jgi:hypothetical protein
MCCLPLVCFTVCSGSTITIHAAAFHFHRNIAIALTEPKSRGHWTRGLLQATHLNWNYNTDHPSHVMWLVFERMDGGDRNRSVGHWTPMIPLASEQLHTFNHHYFCGKLEPVVMLPILPHGSGNSFFVPFVRARETMVREYNKFLSNEKTNWVFHTGDTVVLQDLIPEQWGKVGTHSKHAHTPGTHSTQATQAQRSSCRVRTEFNMLL